MAIARGTSSASLQSVPGGEKRRELEWHSETTIYGVTHREKWSIFFWPKHESQRRKCTKENKVNLLDINQIKKSLELD